MMEVKIPTSKIREVLESSGYAYTPVDFLPTAEAGGFLASR